jgi:hypothetical protein
LGFNVWEYLDYLPTREQLKIPYMIMAALPISIAGIACYSSSPMKAQKPCLAKWPRLQTPAIPSRRRRKLRAKPAPRDARISSC